MAGRVCTLCTHPQTKEIAKALAAGDSQRNIAKRFSVSLTAVNRHANNCLKRLFSQSDAPHESRFETRSENSGTSLFDEIESVFAEALADLTRVAKAAEAARQFKAAVEAITQRSEIALKKWHLFSRNDEHSTDSEQNFTVEIKEAIRPTAKASENNSLSPVSSDSSDPAPDWLASRVQ